MHRVAYRVRLSPEDRQELEALFQSGKHSNQQIKRAQVLLLADLGISNRQIQAVTGFTESTIIAQKKRYLSEGLRLCDKPRRPRNRTLDKQQQDYLLALTGTTPPEGQKRWTMKGLAEKLIELKVVETVSDETVRRTLKKLG